MLSAVILATTSHYVDSVYTNLTVPVRGKPAIAWVVDSIKDNVNKVILVLSSDNNVVEDYVSRFYPSVEIVQIDIENTIRKKGSFSILDSLYCGLEKVENNREDGLRIILGDTLVRKVEWDKEDSVGVSKNFSTSSRWCLVEENDNGIITNFYDKEQSVDFLRKKAVVGYYSFADIELVKNIVEKYVKDNRYRNNTLSILMKDYSYKRPLKTLNIKEWFDFGHMAGLIKARKSLFNSREFNSLMTDSVLGVLTKRSTKVEKLEDEFFWYVNLPKQISVLAPRILSYNVDNGIASLTMEMYGYPNLAELLLCGQLKYEEWNIILEHLFSVHSLFDSYKSTILDDNVILDLYLNKTIERINELMLQGEFWRHLMSYKEIFINNVRAINLLDAIRILKTRIMQLVKNCNVSIMHGDYCFSNILLDLNTLACKLIDPRGRIGNVQTIYGDPRYDIAKLRHSVVGNYDFIVGERFNLTLVNNRFSFYIDKVECYEKIKILFDKLTIQNGYNIEEIKLIEALLFTSMIPLHKDDFNRQKAFFVKALILLNECIHGGGDD